MDTTKKSKRSRKGDGQQQREPGRDINKPEPSHHDVQPGEQRHGEPRHGEQRDENR